MPIYYHYLILSVYQEVRLPLCLSITITYYFLSIKRCSYPYSYLLTLPFTFCLSGLAVKPMSIYYHYLLLSAYREVRLPLCLYITITYYFLSFRRCGNHYAWPYWRRLELCVVWNPPSSLIFSTLFYPWNWCPRSYFITKVSIIFNYRYINSQKLR